MNIENRIAKIKELESKVEKLKIVAEKLKKENTRLREEIKILRFLIMVKKLQNAGYQVNFYPINPER